MKRMTDKEGRNNRAQGSVHTHHENAAESMDMFDFSDSMAMILDAVKHHHMLIGVVCLIVLCMTMLYQYVWPPTYKAQAVITVERSDDSQRDSFYKEWNLFRKDDARTEIKLMTSGSVLQEVIKREHLRYDDVYHPFLAQISYFWEESWLGRTYKSFKNWLLGPSELDTLSPEEKELGKTIRDMRDAFSVEAEGDVLVGLVYAKGPAPRIAHITNTLLDVYLEWRKKQHITEAQRALDTLNEQLTEKNAEIRVLSDRRVEFLNKNKLVFDFSKQTQEMEKLVTLESEIKEERSREATLRASLSDIGRQLKVEPATKVVSSVEELNAVREAAKLRYFDLESTLINQQNRYREDSPEIIELRSNMAKLKELIDGSPEKLAKSVTSGLNPVREGLITKRSALEAELAGLEAGLTEKEQIAKEMRDRQQILPRLAEQLRELDRQFSVAQQVYKVLLTKRDQAAVSLTSSETTMSSLRVVDYASTPASQSWPKAKYLYPGALVFGLILGLMAAVFKNAFNGRVYLRHLGEKNNALPLYATLDVKSGSVIPTNLLGAPQYISKTENRGLPVVLNDGKDVRFEEDLSPYQHLALHMNYEQRREDDTRSGLLISPDSSVQVAKYCLILASSLADVLRRPVLIVEMCAEEGGVGRMLGDSSKSGLYDFLADPGITLRELIVSTPKNNVFFLPAGEVGTSFTDGPSNNNDVANIRMLLTVAREQFDFVLLYGGSILKNSMSLAVAPHVGRVLLTSVENETQLKDLDAAQKSLQLSRVKTVAQVMIRSS